MQSHRLRLKAVFDHANAGRSSTVLALIFGLAAVLFATQAISQTRLNRDTESPPQSAAAAISAPVPTVEEADLAASLPIPFSALAATEAGNQSSSESSSQSVPPPPPPTKPTLSKVKPPHHTLGVILALVGTTAFAAGIALYAGEQSIDLCNGASHGCNEARDAGLVLMPVGAGVAVTGFYFTFHR
ncbi:MAG: hypothetical protein ACLP07_14285 [Terracidiphilus sp.]